MLRPSKHIGLAVEHTDKWIATGAAQFGRGHQRERTTYFTYLNARLLLRVGGSRDDDEA